MSSEPIHPLISMIRRLNRRLVDWIDVPYETATQPIALEHSENVPAEVVAKEPVGIVVERTPNPNAMKYLLPTTQNPRTLTQNAGETDDPFGPLLALEGVRSVFVMETFLTVLKAPDTPWEVLSPQVIERLENTAS